MKLMGKVSKQHGQHGVISMCTAAFMMRKSGTVFARFIQSHAHDRDFTHLLYNVAILQAPGEVVQTIIHADPEALFRIQPQKEYSLLHWVTLADLAHRTMYSV